MASGVSTSSDLPRIATSSGFGKYYALFFVSGFPALLYQIVWQRALFTIYGVNIESVTVIVTAFMLGLGVGSLAGGWLSKRPDIPLLAVFGAIETGIAAFGAISLKIFHAVASFTAGVPAWQTGLTTFGLLLLPTVLMGATLPLLVAHLVRRNGNVGESVGSLYAANTLGSAVACFLAAYVLMRAFGESGCVTVAAAINACVAATAFLLHFRTRQAQGVIALEAQPAGAPRRAVIPFRVGMLLSGVAGFIALGYEMVWYRLYSFAAGRSASCFALLLGWYLAGVAYGSLAVRDFCRGKKRDSLSGVLGAAGSVVIWANIAAFLVGPSLAALAGYAQPGLAYPFVFVGAALLGATFPLISHASIDPAGHAGSGVSWLYLSNIAGCAAGSYIVGFAAMDMLSTRVVSIVLLAIGLATGCALLWATRPPLLTFRRAAALVVAAAALLSSARLYSHLYERLLYKASYTRGASFQHLVETRSGVVAITPDHAVFGGGVYDGFVSTDLANDVNSIFRAFAVDALHPAPKDVLMVGLSMGSWAQVLVNNPRVARLTIVEINPGYLQLIPQYSQVASVLQNPKVEIAIDDGRRWLTRNPGRRFDAIVMNTTQHWLAHASNLLSVEFLRLIQSHLKPGGIHYYNTTFSSDALWTGATVFPYALRVGNFLAVSDSPISFDKDRWRADLLAYSIDGAPALDMNKEADRSALNKLLALADSLHSPDAGQDMRLESAESLRSRLRGSRLVTDDNMATEWR